ncbi:MAG: hypothetical protein ACRC2H_04525, partial [Silanimonas sp.]
MARNRLGNAYARSGRLAKRAGSGASIHCARHRTLRIGEGRGGSLGHHVRGGAIRRIGKVRRAGLFECGALLRREVSAKGVGAAGARRLAGRRHGSADGVQWATDRRAKR